MQSEYAATIHSFAKDLDNLWLEKKASNDKENDDCSLYRFVMSASKNHTENLRSRILPLELTERMVLSNRLAKSAAIWTRPELTRTEAESILKNYGTGVFLVRMNSDKKTMVLTYKINDRVQHVMIKVDLKKGFFMDGSQNVFRNVNIMIAHYMRHPIVPPDILLKLPRALMEASEPSHFKLFENMKLDFWKSAIGRKSIKDIWPNDSPTKVSQSDDEKEKVPPVPPRGYENMEINFIQGSADFDVTESPIYNKPTKPTKPIEFNLNKSPVATSASKTAAPEISSESSERIYSAIWNYHSDTVKDDKRKQDYDLLSRQPPPPPSGQRTQTTKKQEDYELYSRQPPPPPPPSGQQTQTTNYQIQPPSTSAPKVSIDEKSKLVTIPQLIQYFYPELIGKQMAPLNLYHRPTITEEMNMRKKNKGKYEYQFKGRLTPLSVSQPPSQAPLGSVQVAPTPPPPLTQLSTSSLQQCDNDTEIYQASYDVPWDVQSSWVTQLMDLNQETAKFQPGSTNQMATGNKVADTDGVGFGKKLNDEQSNKTNQDTLLVPALPSRKSRISNVSQKSVTSLSSLEDDDDYFNQSEDESDLLNVLLAELQPVVVSEDYENEYSMKNICNFGEEIREFLDNLCSRNGKGEISKAVQTFILCTLDRDDLSPYTTMRLIRQYMSGLKNYITQHKDNLGLTKIIEDVRRNTPKNVFINLDYILESVLTKEVVKPLVEHVYKLLILEHYKNNNLKMLADGINHASSVSSETIGLKEDQVKMIDGQLDTIRNIFVKLSKTFSPEKKIGHMISIVEIVMNMLKSMFTASKSSVTLTTDSMLPMLVYIFSQCTIESLSAQCEVEFIEGLVWSSRVVNGKPGYMLMNLMSALEALKVLGKPNTINWIDSSICTTSTCETDISKLSRSNSSISSSSMGSVNVIIMDENVNRLVLRTFPVRSTVTVRNLCNTIAHRAGIFNPVEYKLYKFDGFEEILLPDYECPLLIKKDYEDKNGEPIQFLFKRHNANFILSKSLMNL